MENAVSGILGIDVGGHGIKIRYERDNLQVIKKVIRKDMSKYTIDSIRNSVEDFIKQNEITPTVLGISQAGIVQENTLQNWGSQFFLRGMGKDDFKSLGFQKVYIINDAEAAAWSASKKYNVQNVVSITIGTGIGFKALINGEPLRGIHGKAGEVHSFPILVKNKSTSFGDLCSGTAIERNFNSNIDYILKHQDEEKVQAIIKEAGGNLGKYIIAAKLFFDPEMIYITGGATVFSGYFEAAMHHVKEYLPAFCSKDRTKIIKSEDPFFDGCIGAAWYSKLQETSGL